MGSPSLPRNYAVRRLQPCSAVSWVLRSSTPPSSALSIPRDIGAQRGRVKPLGFQTEILSEAAFRRRQLPLLAEKAAVQRLSYNHAGAKLTLRRLLDIDPNSVRAWVELGDVWADDRSRSRGAKELPLGGGGGRTPGGRARSFGFLRSDRRRSGSPRKFGRGAEILSGGPCDQRAAGADGRGQFGLAARSHCLLCQDRGGVP